MANNLHISYDLYKQGQDYDKVIAKIKTLGAWAKIHKSYWYVKSNLTAAQAVEAIWATMDSNDSLYIVDSTNNSASWRNISDEASKFIREQWLAKQSV